MLIGGAPVRPEDALYFAKQDIQHFRETDTHLKPDQILAQRYERQTTGTRSPGESPAAYQYLNHSYEAFARTKQQQSENDKLRQKQEIERQRLTQLYTDEQLKAVFGQDLKITAWQLGYRLDWP